MFTDTMLRLPSENMNDTELADEALEYYAYHVSRILSSS